MLDSALVITKGSDALSIDVAKLAKSDLFGLTPCDRTWDELIAQFLIITAVDCPNELTAEENECLLSKLNQEICS